MAPTPPPRPPPCHAPLAHGFPRVEPYSLALDFFEVSGEQPEAAKLGRAPGLLNAAKEAETQRALQDQAEHRAWKRQAPPLLRIAYVPSDEQQVTCPALDVSGSKRPA